MIKANKRFKNYRFIKPIIIEVKLVKEFIDQFNHKENNKKEQ